MRIESPVGCPTSAGDPVEEKTVPDGSIGLFTSILDCFRVLVSGASSEEASSCETPAVPGKSADRDQVIPAEPPSLQAPREAVAARLNGVREEDCHPPQDLPEGSEDRAVPALIIPAGAPFSLAIPGFVGDEQPTSRMSDAATHQTVRISPEVFAPAKAGTPADFHLQAEMRGLNLHTQAGPLIDPIPAHGTEAENGAETTLTEGSSAEHASMPADIDQDEEASNPQVSTTAAGRPVPPAAVQASATALMIDARFLRADRSPGNDGKPPDMSSVPARPTSVILSNGGIDPGAKSRDASVTMWMPQRNVSATKVSVSETGGRPVRSTATSQPTAMSEDKFAGTRVAGLTGETSPAVDAGLEELDTGSYVPAQKSMDKALPSAPGHEADRQETGKQADSRPAATDLRADLRLQPESGSATRSAGPSKITTATEPAASASELEKIAAGRGRSRTTVDGGAREVSAGSQLSAMTRDAQVSLPGSTGIKDAKAPAFVFEVAERIATVVAGTRGEVTIQLKPDEFGRMNIVAESGASGILARITTESASLKQYLENNLPVLHQALQDQGLKVDRIDVLVQEDLSRQQSASQWQHNFGHAPGGHNSDRNPKFAQAAAVQQGAPANEITLDAITLGALHPNSTFHTIA